jgi:hypothetical protein
MSLPNLKNHRSLPQHVQFAASLGFRLFPIKPGEKTPLLANWQNIATSDVGQLQTWAMRFPGCNWAVATGNGSRVFVLDVDGEDGALSLAGLEAQHGELPRTLEVSTARGRHIYFVSPDIPLIRNSASRLGKGLDIRGEGGYVIIPPSVHPNGSIYDYANPEIPVADAPEWLVDQLVHLDSPPVLVPSPAQDLIPKGKRNNTLISLAGMMRRKGMTREAIEAALLAENRHRCNPPIADDEVLKIVASIMRYSAVLSVSASEVPPEWPELERLESILPNVAQFDLKWMPESLRPLVKDVAERMQVPLDFPAVAAIATLAGVTNRRAVIQPKREDTAWVVVPNLWGGIVAPPGMLKSPVISSMTRPAKAIEREWRKAYEEEDGHYLDELESHEEEVKAWKTQNRKAILIGQDRPPKPTSELAKPLLKRLITSDATYESLHQLLSENPAGLLVTRDELAGWLAGLERQGREQERAFYLECWSGDSDFTLDRIGRGSVYVPHTCISLFGGIQPARLRAYLAEALRDGPSNDGLIQRFQLLVYPDAPADWEYVDQNPDLDALARAELVYRRVAEIDVQMPLRLKFDEPAQAFFVEWLTELERRIRDEEIAPVMRAHLAKYRKLMPALALLFALADGHTEAVPLRYAQMAGAWCAYLETHAQRIYSSQARPGHSAAVALSKRLANGWKRDERTFSLRDVYRKGWTYLDTPERAGRALQILEEYGWVRPVEDPQLIGRPSEKYLLNPRIKLMRPGKEEEELEAA